MGENPTRICSDGIMRIADVHLLACAIVLPLVCAPLCSHRIRLIMYCIRRMFCHCTPFDCHIWRHIPQQSRGNDAIFAVLALCLPACHLLGSSHVSAGASSGAALALVDYIKQIRPWTLHAAVACLALFSITWFYSSKVADWQGDLLCFLPFLLVYSSLLHTSSQSTFARLPAAVAKKRLHYSQS